MKMATVNSAIMMWLREIKSMSGFTQPASGGQANDDVKATMG
jgi:hypothetical protein